MIIFGSIGIFRRNIALSSGLLAFSRGVIGVLFLCLFVKLRGRRIRHGLSRRGVLWLALSGAAIGFNWILLFEAYNRISVPVATLCYYMQPTIVILLSPLLLRERLTITKLICACTAVLGMVCVSGVLEDPERAYSDVGGILMALGAAVLYAAVIIMNKRSEPSDAYEKTIIQLSTAAVVLIPYILATENFQEIRFSLQNVILLLIVGLVHTGIAYTLYFSSMDGLKGQTVAILSYIDPVTALVLSAIVLNESLSVLGMLGAVLILGSAFTSEWLPGVIQGFSKKPGQ